MEQRQTLKATGRLRTYGDWQAGNVGLGEFLAPGDRVDEAMADYFLEVVFPACMDADLIQCGEPDHHDGDGKPRYATVQRVRGAWIFTGYYRQGQRLRVL